jgi:hypothetical protein
VGALLLGEGEGEVHTVGPSRVTIKAGGDETGGTFDLGEAEIEPSFPGPPPDSTSVPRHVLRPRATVDRAARQLNGRGDSRARSAAFLPGVAYLLEPQRRAGEVLELQHAFRWEGYMPELASAFASGEPPTSEAIGRIASQSDVKLGNSS